jgi:glycosyltransferase involved in cell wall biosynthesis
MKIAVLANSFWNIYNFRLGLIKSLKLKGHEIICIAPYDKYFEHLLNIGIECYDIKIDNNGMNPIKDLRLIYNYYQLLKVTSPSVVLSFTIKPNIYGNFSCRFLGIKTINNISGLGTVFINKNIVTRIVIELYKFTLAKSSVVFFQNSDDKDIFLDNNIVKSSKCSLLPGSGINTSFFSPVKKIENDYFVFLLAARMIWDKGIKEYFEAASIIIKKYKKVKFQLVGQIDSHNKASVPYNKIKEYVDNGIINYLGEASDIRPYLERADCVVLPSYREGVPRVLLEGISMEKPIIATNVAGCKETVIDGHNGYLCQVKDSNDLSIKMERMLNLSNKKRNSMGKMGRRLAIQKFDESIVFSKYSKAVDLAIKEM